jgi:deoxyinosine 3'endonuclease (endonuclease V)
MSSFHQEEGEEVEHQHAEWSATQARLQASLIEVDTFAWEDLKLIGGLDLSFLPSSSKDEESNEAVACLVVLSFPQLEVLYESFLPTTLTSPYISGFLAFREAPPMVELVQELQGNNPDLTPQLLIVDGNGVLHPRGCGLASHVGLMTGLPSVGCAKTFLHVDGLETKGVREAIRGGGGGVRAGTEGGREEGEGGDISSGRSLPLVGASGRTLGMAFCPAGIINPLYISVGTGTSLPTAMRVIKACCKHRVPEPVRQADLRSRAWIRERAQGQEKEKK